ncbi:Piwi domain-containing protein [Xylariaceae sp. FL0255]|nr:Piwi domain-containing protein [Xylariaceae sp. FL0255]
MSRQGSRPGSRRQSVAGSQAGAAPQGYPAPLGYDPARIDQPKEMTVEERIGKRIDLPADAYCASTSIQRFTTRPAFNTTGRPIGIYLNVFPVEKFRNQEIFQYDVAVSPCPSELPVHRARALHKKVFKHATVQAFINSNGGMWLYDGHKLAWSSKPIPNAEKRISVDLDADKKNRKDKSKGVYYIHIKQTNVVRLAYLDQYLKGKAAWDNHVLQGMNFFDHCMRQGPSEKMMSIRRNFYPYDSKWKNLGAYICVKKGYYSAARLSESDKKAADPRTGLMINVDVANTAFWQPLNIADVALRMVREHKREWANFEFADMGRVMKPVKADKPGGSMWTHSEAFSLLRKLGKLKFNVRHRNKMEDQKVYTIRWALFEEKYGPEGGNAKTCTFDKKMPDGSMKTISVYDHYLQHWNVRLQHPYLPLLVTTRAAFFPMELCTIMEYQRYNYKLSPDQTSEMIKFALTRPAQRKADIMDGVRAFDFAHDKYLNEFGVKISTQMQPTNARLLENPQILFGGNQKINPQLSGRWDLRGKRFYKPHDTPLKSWGFVACCGATDQASLERFASQFSNIYRGHGGKIEGKPLTIVMSPMVGDYAKICETVWQKIGDANKMAPQIIFFAVPNKNALVYERIKKNMDCRWTIPSQVMVGGHVTKCNPQYMSNVSMKVNAKLGGATCVTIPTKNKGYYTEPTMMIGVDVSHAAPNSLAGSTAAMSVSLDKEATKYAGACQTNGFRVELLIPGIMNEMFLPLLKAFFRNNKCVPKHIYYLRDGVDEGQFEKVISQEIVTLRRIFREHNFPEPKFTVIIATKRHHIRFFPKEGDKSAADRNNNPLPGTLVERDCTHPHHFDFYLCSHVAIQGTARPVHYQVIYDDAKCTPDALQKLLYEQCYQYCRSTTPVSLHPAIYYAHLISQRARAHENIPSSAKEMVTMKQGHPIRKKDSDIYTDRRDPMQAPPLLPMGNPQTDQRAQFMNTVSMWYA